MPPQVFLSRRRPWSIRYTPETMLVSLMQARGFLSMETLITRHGCRFCSVFRIPKLRWGAAQKVAQTLRMRSRLRGKKKTMNRRQRLLCSGLHEATSCLNARPFWKHLKKFRLILYALTHASKFSVRMLRPSPWSPPMNMSPSSLVLGWCPSLELHDTMGRTPQALLRWHGIGLCVQTLLGTWLSKRWMRLNPHNRTTSLCRLMFSRCSHGVKHIVRLSSCVNV